MEHEKRKKRHQKHRLIIMGIIIPILAIIAIAIVFFAFGWRFDSKNKKLYASSVLYLRSQPLGANIHINNKLQGETKLLQRHVKPGVYNLRLTKDGFMTWEAILDVPASSVVEVDPYLFYQKPKLQKEIVFDKFLNSNQQKVAFIKDGQIAYCDLPCDKYQNLILKDFSFTKTYLSDKKIYFEYADFFLSINLNNQKQEKINKPTDFDIKKIALNNTGVYVLADNDNLYQLTKTNPLLIQEKVKSIITDQDWLYYITQKGELSAKLDQIKNIATNTILAKNFDQTKLKISNLSLTNFSNNAIFLIDNGNYFLLKEKQAEFIGTNLQNYIMLDGYSAWLTDSGDLYLKIPDSEKARFINNYFNNPKNIFFFSPEYVALVYDKQLKMIETTTKQEFILFNYKKANNYLYPSTETEISQINNTQISNYKVTENTSFWQKILKIFSR